MGEGDTLWNAVVGAVVTVVLSFTGFSPLIGGGVAGYLQQGTRKGGATVGAISGAIAFLPFLLVVAVGVGLLSFVSVGSGFGAPGFIELLVIVLLVFPLFLLWNVGLGAVGGYLGIYLREGLESTDP